MAESLKFTGLEEATEVFPDLPWKASGSTVWIYDEKKDDYFEVGIGDYIVHIADRYEVHDEEPARAKPAEAPEEPADEE